MSNPTTRVAKAGGLLTLGLLSALPIVRSPAAAAEPELRLRALAVNMSGVGRPGAETLDIVIERWSTDADQKMVIDTLKERGDKLLDALQDLEPRAGYIRTTTSLGWDIQYARQEELSSGGRRVVFATDRPMSFYELRNRTRSSEFEFMFCEIRLRPDGKGEGKLSTVAKIRWDAYERAVEIEDYAIEPVRLTQVSVVK